jgi:hypothetical protein
MENQNYNATTGVESFEIKESIGGPKEIQLVYLYFNPKAEIFLEGKPPVSRNTGSVMFRNTFDVITIVSHPSSPPKFENINIEIRSNGANIYLIEKEEEKGSYFN